LRRFVPTKIPCYTAVFSLEVFNPSGSECQPYKHLHSNFVVKSWCICSCVTVRTVVACPVQLVAS